MYKALQEQVQFRTLMFLLVAVIVMALLSGFLYVIKQPLQAFHQHQQTLSLLQSEIKTGIPLQNQIEMQQKLVAQLTLKLQGAGSKLPVNKMVAYVIGELDKIANRHQIYLSRVKPLAEEALFTFREVPFQVEIRGDYFSLYAWLKDIEKNLGPIVIKQFDMSAVGREKQRKMLLTIAAYQFEGKK